MVYKIRAVSDEIDDFRRDILIDSESTFLALKDILCESCGYDASMLCSFFICDDNWEKYQEVTLHDMGSDMTSDVYTMADTKLDDLIEDVGQKLLFTFDYLGDRSLFLQVKDDEFGVDLPEPECILSRGEAPAQVMDINEIDSLTDAKLSKAEDYDLGEEFGDDEGYDEEDIRDFDEMNY